MHTHTPTADERNREVLAQLAALPDLPMEILTQRWQTITGHPAPRHNKRALMKRLAYAIQEAAWGGLPPETHARLETVYSQQASETQSTVLTTGSALLREWHGVTYRVSILPQGYEYTGRFFTSLSAIAREITGSRISGPAFFRLTGGAR